MPKQLIKGNEAIVKSAILAGCRAFYGYPITPASEIAEAAAKYMPLVGGVFLQAESEVASINMLYGAAAAGLRTMTASSGPGISLMQEGLSYLAGAELPCVIADIMRAGPGLGNIAPEQGDLFVRHARLANRRAQSRETARHRPGVVGADRVEVERAAMDCDLGSVSLSSTLRRDAQGVWSLAGLLHQRHGLSGQMDVARLARFLPATLRLRQQVEVNSGQVQWALSSRPAPQGMQWHAQLEASHLTATAAGRQIAWERPM